MPAKCWYEADLYLKGENFGVVKTRGFSAISPICYTYSVFMKGPIYDKINKNSFLRNYHTPTLYTQQRLIGHSSDHNKLHVCGPFSFSSPSEIKYMSPRGSLFGFTATTASTDIKKPGVKSHSNLLYSKWKMTKDILCKSFNNIFLGSTLSFQSQRNSKLLWDGQEFVEPLYPRLITIWWSGLWWISPFPSHTEEVIFCVKNIRDLPHDTLMNRAPWKHNIHVNI